MSGHADALEQTRDSLALGRAIAALSQARMDAITTEAQHDQLFKRMQPSQDLLMQMFETSSISNRADPYMSMLMCLKQAAVEEIISSTQLKQLVERIEASARALVDLGVPRSDRWLVLIDRVFPLKNQETKVDWKARYETLRQHVCMAAAAKAWRGAHLARTRSR